MYEENRKFSWTNLFIKAIIVLIFILFTVWLLSLSNKGLSNSLNVLTDDIFSQNMDRMKEVGKEYFTTERLPEKVGEIETLTLAKMYDEHLILELKDKYGNVCSAKNSYVTVEKMENEYQMKVYLECGEEEDYIIVIMGCYDYCDTDICERKDETDTSKQIEYEYSKPIGGEWTDYGNWSEWSKVSVTKTDYRMVETKIVKEDYSYDKQITETVYKGEASCPTVSGFTLVSKVGDTCNYTKPTSTTANPVCLEKDGYEVTRNGFTCTYTKKVPSYSDPYCPAWSGYTVTRSGATCTYTKPKYFYPTSSYCPYAPSGYNYSYVDGLTCWYKGYNYSTKCEVRTGKSIPTSNSTYTYTYMSVKTTSDCTGCSTYLLYTYKACWQTSTTVWTSRSAWCPSGYVASSSYCVDSDGYKETATAKCSVGTLSGNSCLSYNTVTEEEKATCKNGTPSGNVCLISGTEKTTRTATCPAGQDLKDGKCYDDVTSTVTVSGTKDVTYYRYKVRQYINGTIDYKWSTSKNDQKLIADGYKLTGKTR